VNQTIRTATRNLIEGGIIVMAVLFLMLLQLRAGLIVSSAIPLSMLLAIIGMRHFNISANLMSLGAIDFGLIVDGAVIIVENCVRRLAEARDRLGRGLTPDERMKLIGEGAVEVRRASQYGEMIIIAAYIPIVSLAGIEGKMFRPMAFTVILALSAALVLSLTLIPALCAAFLREPRKIASPHTKPIVAFFQRLYEPTLRWTLSSPRTTIACALLFVAGCTALLPFLGTEFLPKLDEGAIAINLVRLPSVSLTQAIQMTSLVERAIREFPEVRTVVSRIGSPEIATDPMGPDMGDTYVILNPRNDWKSAATKEELVNKMALKLESIPGMAYSFSQPIEFRMMELIEGIGARSDVVVKLFGDDLGTLQENGARLAQVIAKIRGAADVKVSQTSGLPVLQIKIDRDRAARYGVNVSDVQDVVRTAVAGTEVTRILEGTRRFSLVARFAPSARSDPESIGSLLVSAPDGSRVQLRQVAIISEEEGPSVVSREEGERLTTIEANVRGRDIGSFVSEARTAVDRQVILPPSYHLQWGGLWEYLESGRNRLLLVVPVTFFVVFLLLSATFQSVRHAALIFTAVPFAMTGGVLSLILRQMPFSMSAGIGFIAVSGVAVLNGVVMVAFINQLRKEGKTVSEAVAAGALTRLRPVLMTAFVASLGFLPMAVSTSAGAEVQRPLATVVIGGLVTSTLLTLFVLPALYRWQEDK
jgi:cobalt-zinc-cadmium resistance protein CzcA